jgi:hypothetical protein
VYPIRLHLRPGVREHFMGWLTGAHPELTRTYEDLYRDRVYLPRHPNGRTRSKRNVTKSETQPALPFG